MTIKSLMTQATPIIRHDIIFVSLHLHRVIYVDTGSEEQSLVKTELVCGEQIIAK